MSKEDVIASGLIGKKKLAAANAITAAKAALRALAEAAVYAKVKQIEQINTAEMTAHLEQLISKQEELRRINEEIQELEY